MNPLEGLLPQRLNIPRHQGDRKYDKRVLEIFRYPFQPILEKDQSRSAQ